MVEPAGIGGWLYVVALGLLLSPLRLLAAFVGTLTPVIRDGAWATLTSPDSSAYHPLWATVIVVESLGNLACLLASITLLVLFVKRSSRFPKLFIWVTILTFPYVVLLAWLGSLVLPNEPVIDPTTARQLVSSIVVIGIWVPYMLLSRRVRNTFIA